MKQLLLILSLFFFTNSEAASTLHEKAYQAHLSTFKHQAIIHPRLLVLFSGTPGMGKTTLSLHLENALQGIRVGADDARYLLRDHYHTFVPSTSEFNDSKIGLEEYLHYCLSTLDSESNNHLIILDRSIDGIEEEALKMADKLGYDTYIVRLECQKPIVEERLRNREEDPSLHLSRLDKWYEQYEQFPLEMADYSLNVEKEWENLPLTHLVDALQKKITTVPSTDRDLPRTPPENVGALYDCLARLIPVLQKHDIDHWAFCGTALGMARHGGMIPWDDDIDLAIYAKDIEKLINAEEDLKEAGLSLYTANGYYKILKIGGEPIPKEEDPDTFYLWTYPFVDLFPMSHVDGIVHYSCQRLRDGLTTEYLRVDQLEQPLLLKDFGPLKLPLPHRIDEYLDRIYGPDWPWVAYAQYIHRFEKTVKKVKVRLEDYSPAEYILP